MMNEQRPSAGPDQPLNRHPPAVSAKLVSALPAMHRIARTSTVKLRSPFAKPEHRFVSYGKVHRARLLIDAKSLNMPAVICVDEDRQRIRRQLHQQISATNRLHACEACEPSRRKRPRFLSKRPVVWNGSCASVFHGRQADARGEL